MRSGTGKAIKIAVVSNLLGTGTHYVVKSAIGDDELWKILAGIAVAATVQVLVIRAML